MAFYRCGQSGGTNPLELVTHDPDVIKVFKVNASKSGTVSITQLPSLLLVYYTSTGMNSTDGSLNNSISAGGAVIYDVKNNISRYISKPVGATTNTGATSAGITVSSSSVTCKNSSATINRWYIVAVWY